MSISIVTQYEGPIEARYNTRTEDVTVRIGGTAIMLSPADAAIMRDALTEALSMETRERCPACHGQKQVVDAEGNRSACWTCNLTGFAPMEVGAR